MLKVFVPELEIPAAPTLDVTETEVCGTVTLNELVPALPTVIAPLPVNVV